MPTAATIDQLQTDLVEKARELGFVSVAFAGAHDDPVMADHVLREARRALDGDAPYDKELVHLAALATSDGPGDARAAAHRWYERQPHNFDTWMVTDSAIDLLRHLSDLRATQVAGGIAGDDLTRDAVLDAVSAELIEVEMATGTTDFKDET